VGGEGRKAGKEFGDSVDLGDRDSGTRRRSFLLQVILLIHKKFVGATIALTLAI
jgi:hypothetical protein